MKDIVIYHNGECSKCRGALELLQEAGVPYTARWYLADPLSRQELLALLNKLGMQPSEIIRKSEPLYQELYAGRELTEAECLDALTDHPMLMQRPIIELPDMAIIARPPERVYEIIEPAK